MISERTRRSVYIETILAPEEVRAAFGQCGEMYVQPVILYDRLLMSPYMRDSRGVYAAGVTEDSLPTRYFVEYRDTRAAKHACDLQLDGTTMHALEPCTELAGYFQAVVSPDLPQKPHSEVIQTARWSPYSRNASKIHKRTRQGHQARQLCCRPRAVEHVC